MCVSSPLVLLGAGARWRRRAVSLPAYLLLTLLVVGLLPVLLPAAFVADLLRRSRLAAVRCLLVLAWPAWLRVLTLLPVVALLWLAVAWANMDIAPW